MTLTVERPPVGTPEDGVIEEARARQRRHRAVTGALIVVAAVAVILSGTTGGGGGSHLRSASSPARPSATHARRSQASCTGKALRGAPDKSLLTILGVLRRPATASDALSGIAGGGIVRGTFTRYIRRARVVAGSPYYVYPAVVGGCGTREKPREGIMMLARNVDLGHGLIGATGGGGATAAQIEQGQLAGSGPPGSSTSATLTMVVPDGVASVTLHYPAGRASGYSPKISPPVTITTAPVENLVVVRVPRSSPLHQATTIWRAGNGHVIKTIKKA